MIKKLKESGVPIERAKMRLRMSFPRKAERRIKKQLKDILEIESEVQENPWILVSCCSLCLCLLKRLAHSCY